MIDEAALHEDFLDPLKEGFVEYVVPGMRNTVGWSECHAERQAESNTLRLSLCGNRDLGTNSAE